MLTKDEDEDLSQALEEPFAPKLHEELLSDAQAAIYQGNLRRAVVEMAIACEVVVKQAYFAQSSPAGAAFDYLEAEKLIQVPVKELIDKVAKRAFGESFKTLVPKHYTNIDYLFRCRNKVAHRGELIFRDEQGKSQQVDRKTIDDWWQSTEELIAWLDRKTTSP